MAELRLEHIYKVYPNGVKAVSDFTMNIKDKEFIVFVGPSGCGKSTTLRMIAGLEDISAGELYIGDKIVNDVEPKDRDIAMVFQNYALYPHMTVYENMAFGLQLRHIPAEEIHERVIWAAKILGLTEYLDRKPKAMSGGQRQRVALGRAILRNPKVMLLDEPLSNLDAKLRAQMRSEIAKLHQDLQTTFIYVTHDQVEAMTLGTRVVVMKLGVIQQIDTPKNLYDFPTNKFVAGFIGTPQMNFFEGYLTLDGDKVNVKFDYSDNELVCNVNDLIKVQPHYFDGNHKVWIGIRCEALSVDPEIVANSTSKIKMKVSHFEELGNETLIYGDINMNGDGFGETSTRIIVKGTSSYGYKPGDIIDCHFDVSKTHFFDYKTEESIVPRIPELNVIKAEISDGYIVFDGLKMKLPAIVNLENQVGDLYLPISAIELGKGEYSGEIVNIEHVDDKLLAYIKLNSRIIFSLVDDSYKVGDKISLNIDIANINFKVDGKDVIQVMDRYNKISSTFVNFATANSNEKNKYQPILNARIEEVNNKYDSLAKEINDKYDALIAEASKKDFASIRENNNNLYNSEKEKTDKLLNELKEKYTSGIKEAKKQHSINKKDVSQKVKDEYERRKKEENESYKLFLSANKDKDVYRKRKAEHQEFKENFPKERENDLNKALDAESLNYETVLNSIKSPYKREKKVAIKNLKALKKKIDRENNEVSYLGKERENELKVLEKSKKVDLAKAKQIFFFKIAGNLYQSSDLISNKMIQGLGTKVFVKNFLIEIPNDKIELSDTGIEAVVNGSLAYGEHKYLTCDVKDNDGKTLKFYVRSEKEVANGTKVYLTFNMDDTMITETSMNIRIY